jgi:hypothetical protein
MACIDPTVWQQAVASCTLSKAPMNGLRGLGAPNYVRTGMRGLGINLSISAPTGVQSALNFLTPNTPGGVVAPPPPPNQAPAKPSAPTGIRAIPAAPAGSMNDPCALAAQAPCSVQGLCPAGTHPVSPGPGVTNCALGPVPGTVLATPMTAVMTPQVTAPAPMTTTTKVAIAAGVGIGGFVLWKLLVH